MLFGIRPIQACHDIFGGGGGGGGNTTSTTQVNVPPPTAAELELQQVNLQAAQVLFDQLVTTTNLQNNVLTPLFAEQAGIILEFAPEAGGGGDAGGAATPGAGQTVHDFIPSEAGNFFQGAAARAQQQGIPILEAHRSIQADFNANPQAFGAPEGFVSGAAAPAGTTTTGGGGPAPGSITGFSLTPEAQERLDLSQQVQTAGLEAQLSATESANALAQTLIEETPEFSLEEALAFITAAEQSAIASGENEIIRFQELALQNLFEVQAPGRGLRPTDSPIEQFGGGRVLEESVRQQGQLVRDVTTTSEQLKVQAQQFQAQLEQAAFVNRSNLLGTLGNFGLGFPSAPSPGAQLAPIGQFGAGLAQGGIPGMDLANSLAAQRFAQPTIVSTSPQASNTGAILGGLGGLGQGLGALGFNPFGASSAASFGGAAGGSSTLLSGTGSDLLGGGFSSTVAI